MRSRFVSQALRVLQEKVVLDSNQTAFLERELTQLRAREFDVQLPDLLARSFVPIATDIDPTTDLYEYKVWRHTGKAKVVANAADDAPIIEVGASPRQGKVYKLRAAYQWDIEELALAASRGIPLSGRKMRAARREIEEGIDEMLAHGYTTQPGEAGLLTTGLLNHPDVEGNAYARVEQFSKWTEASDPDNILDDLQKPVTAVLVDTKMAFRSLTMLLPVEQFALISQKKVGVDNHTSILKAFLENNPYVTEVQPWFRCDEIGQNSTGRAVVFAKSDEVLEGVVPQEYTELAPQARNEAFIVNVSAKCGGVKVYRPDAVRYADFAAA